MAVAHFSRSYCCTQLQYDRLLASWQWHDILSVSLSVTLGIEALMVGVASWKLRHGVPGSSRALSIHSSDAFAVGYVMVSLSFRHGTKHSDHLTSWKH